MKSFILIITILIGVLNISIPSVLTEMSMFDSQAEISLSDFVEANQNSNDGEKEEDTVEFEEVETEFFVVNSFNYFGLTLRPITFNLSLHSFFPTYLFSIFIPPSL